MILDGYGLNEKTQGNAVAQADTPVMELPFTVVRSGRKTMAISIKEDGEIIFRVTGGYASDG